MARNRRRLLFAAVNPDFGVEHRLPSIRSIKTLTVGISFAIIFS
jgi:hypothetical protein